MKLIIVGASASLILAQAALAVPAPAYDGPTYNNIYRREPTRALVDRDIAHKLNSHRFDSAVEIDLKNGASQYEEELKIKVNRRDLGKDVARKTGLMEELKDFFQSISDSLKGIVLFGHAKNKNGGNGNDDDDSSPSVTKIVIATKTKSSPNSDTPPPPAPTDGSTNNDPTEEVKDTSAGSARPGSPSVPTPTGTPAVAVTLKISRPEGATEGAPAPSPSAPLTPPAPSPIPVPAPAPAVSRRALAQELHADYVAEGVIDGELQRRSIDENIYNKAFEAAEVYKKVAKRALSNGLEDYY